jgi:hypothetical protein
VIRAESEVPDHIVATSNLAIKQKQRENRRHRLLADVSQCRPFFHNPGRLQTPGAGAKRKKPL